MDYAATDVVAAVRALYPDGIDALIDLVNRGEAFAPVADLVRDGGRIATTLGSADVDALAARNVTGTNVAGNVTHDKLATLIEAVEAGTLTVPVQQTFSLDETPAAARCVQRGNAREDRAPDLRAIG